MSRIQLALEVLVLVERDESCPLPNYAVLLGRGGFCGYAGCVPKTESRVSSHIV